MPASACMLFAASLSAPLRSLSPRLLRCFFAYAVGLLFLRLFAYAFVRLFCAASSRILYAARPSLSQPLRVRLRPFCVPLHVRCLPCAPLRVRCFSTFLSSATATSSCFLVAFSSRTFAFSFLLLSFVLCFCVFFVLGFYSSRTSRCYFFNRRSGPFKQGWESYVSYIGNTRLHFRMLCCFTGSGGVWCLNTVS